MAIRQFGKALLLLLCTPLVGDNALIDTTSQKISSTISCPASIQEAIGKGAYKPAIKELQALTAKKGEAALYLQLAVCYLQDQQEEEAFKAYISCLEKAYSKVNRVMNAREEASFKELLPLYFANAIDLEEKLTTCLKAHPDYTYVQFMLAAQAANAKKYEPFFYLFYNSYCSYPESHMSHKTQGVIASLLLQRVKSPDEKDVWRKRAIRSFLRASELCPEDTGLYRMIIFTSSEKERKVLVQQVIGQIIETNSKIPRGEIPFFINAALMVDEVKLAQDLLDKAKTWYEYSRIIDEMQSLVLKSQGK